MPDILLRRHGFDGRRLDLAGEVPGARPGLGLRAALLPPWGEGEAPLQETRGSVGPDGSFRLALGPIEPRPGLRLVLEVPGDAASRWIGSGAAVPASWFAAAVPTGPLDPPVGGGGPPIGGVPEVPVGDGKPGEGTPGDGKPGGDPPGGGLPGGDGPVRPPSFRIPCLCALLPVGCSTLLGAWKALLLLALGLWYAALVLAPPDWGLRTAVCIITDEALKAGRTLQVGSTAGLGGAAGGAGAGAAVGGLGGGAAGTAVAPGPGTAAGAAGGAGAGGTAGGIGAGASASGTALAGEAAVQSIDRTLRGIVGLVDGVGALLGMLVHLLAEILGLVALAILLAWFVCCARGDACRLIANLCWVLEAALVVLLPLLGAGLGFLLWAWTWLPTPACARVGTQWFIELGGGLLLGTLLYGGLRWLRDRRRCPVLVLWQWPWTERTP